MIIEMQTFEWVLIGLCGVALLAALITVARELARRKENVDENM